MIAPEDIVQGPELSPEFGRCLFVDPTCETHRANTFPTQAHIVTQAARRMIELSKAGEKLESIVLMGTKDPTLHPEFRQIVENLRELTNKWFPKAKLCLVSAGCNIDSPDVRTALTVFDRPVVRLDGGTQKTFSALSECNTSLKILVESLSRLELDRLIVETRFVRGSADNSTDSEVRAWIRHLNQLKPRGLRVSTLEKPDRDKQLKAITKTRFQAIQDEVSKKTNVQIEVAVG